MQGAHFKIAPQTLCTTYNTTSMGCNTAAEWVVTWVAVSAHALCHPLCYMAAQYGCYNNCYMAAHASCQISSLLPAEVDGSTALS